MHYVIVFLHKNLIGNVDSNNNINDNGGEGVFFNTTLVEVL